jgi:hypothetical protein
VNNKFALLPLHTTETLEEKVVVGTGITVITTGDEETGLHGELVTLIKYVVVTEGETLNVVPLTVVQVVPLLLLNS